MLDLPGDAVVMAMKKKVRVQKFAVGWHAECDECYKYICQFQHDASPKPLTHAEAVALAWLHIKGVHS